MEELFSKLKTRLAEVHDLEKADWLLGWDERTYMPPAGAPARAEARATLRRTAHRMFTADETGRLLEALRPWAETLDYDSDKASLVRVAARDYEKRRRVPDALVAEMARTASLAHKVWIRARAESDFGLFLPHLQKVVDLKFKYVECFDEPDEIYDLLLDDYERGMKTAEVRATFEALKRELLPLLRATSALPKGPKRSAGASVAERGDEVDDACMYGDYPEEGQRAFVMQVLQAFTFSPEWGRLDKTVHPFASSFSTGDIRLTTRFKPDYLGAALFGAMHECGHGLYEQGVDPALSRTLLCRGASLGMHESQSRMWENIVGRSRPFWQHFFPRLRAAFPGQLAGVEAETFYRAINKVQPSLIRVEADEATYNLHIILRFELEQAVMNGELALKDLPEAWNARMKEYLGVEVPDDARGVLQDIHWSTGGIGYFPTYSLGNIISAQIWERALAAHPDLPEEFARGEFGALREWLRGNLHCHGRKFTSRELLQRLTGGGIDVRPYANYLKNKLSDIYGLA
ncbi:MAG: carboxypeptidase M32 [Chloroflexi bacterium]|nr:carboxypeptidase M32 [Chloroflexota bacterium]